MQTVTDEQFRAWAAAIRHSDQAAFAAFFDTMHAPLHRYAVYIVHDADAASDLVQDAFAKLWQVRSELDPDRSLKALLFQILRNLALNHERRRRRHHTEPLDEDTREVAHSHSVDDEMDAEALGRLVQQWVDDMPDRRREAFLLSRRENLSHDEIAQLMGLAPKTVNNHIVLALQHIRQKIEAFRAQDGQPDP